MSPDDSGWHSSKDAAACKSIHFAFAKKIGVEDAAIYCVSEDTTLGGFQCFKGDGWLSSMLDYLGHDAYSGNEAIELNQTSCNSLELDSEDAGTLYVGGQCCTGGAVPCNHPLCRHGFRPLGPAVTSSVVSVVLVIIALVHCFTSLQCIVFADRLIENARSAKDMGADDKAAFKNIITMLGAAHGGFAGILVFGALQDWFSGKSQVAMAALAWYGVLGPVAEAMQYKREHGSSVQYVNACVSAAQAECGGQVPKVNYHLLCIPLLIAIGVRAAAAAAAATLRGARATAPAPWPPVGRVPASPHTPFLSTCSLPPTWNDDPTLR